MRISSWITLRNLWEEPTEYETHSFSLSCGILQVFVNLLMTFQNAVFCDTDSIRGCINPAMSHSVVISVDQKTPSNFKCRKRKKVLGFWLVFVCSLVFFPDKWFFAEYFLPLKKPGYLRQTKHNMRIKSIFL